jgi:hypothetical protein
MGFDGFEIGEAQQSGTIGVFDSLDITGDLHLHAGMGDIVIGAPITATGNVTTTGDGGTTMIDADMAATSITFNDALRIDRNVVLTVTNGGITYNGVVVSQANEANDVTIRSDGDVVFQGPVGNAIGGALGDILIITAGNVAITSTIEAESLVIIRSGDYNHNQVVDAADYVLWRKTLDTTGWPAYSGADGNGNTIVDPEDYSIWRTNYGNSLLPPAAGSGSVEVSNVERQVPRNEGPSTGSIAENLVGEPIAPILEPATLAPAETVVATARAASFAALETCSLWRDSNFCSRGKLLQYPPANSGSDYLPLLMVIDSRWQTSQKAQVVSGDHGSEQHHTDDDDSQSRVDGLLAALAEWQ